MIKLKEKAEPVAAPQVTKNSLNQLVEHAFDDMLKLLNNHTELSSRAATAEEIRAFQQRAAMFTVSSSYFRLIILLHYPEGKTLSSTQIAHLRPELQNDTQQYLDYVCELGNNLCGVVCRILGNDSFSTGMSTPSLLNINNSAGHLQRTNPLYETHRVSMISKQPLFGATFALFCNSAAHTELKINIPTATVGDDSLGELEFF